MKIALSFHFELLLELTIIHLSFGAIFISNEDYRQAIIPLLVPEHEWTTFVFMVAMNLNLSIFSHNLRKTLLDSGVADQNCREFK